MSEQPKRKRIRLENFDYSRNGAYFITVCSKDKECIFGSVLVGQGLCSCRLSQVGEIVRSEIEDIEKRFPNAYVDNYVIMPNHIHLLLRLDTFRQEQSPCPTVSDIICALKSISTKEINKAMNTPGNKIWQDRFHDHVIRGEADYREIWEYIDNNPIRWTLDKYYE